MEGVRSLTGDPTHAGMNRTRMTEGAAPLTLREITARLSQLGEEWDQLLKNQEAVVHELQATKDELQKVLREYGTTRALYEQLLSQRDEILGVLQAIVSRYERGRD
jgi:chromosome segregation ATPase